MSYEQEQEEGLVVDTPDISTLAVLNKSEIDTQIVTAKRFPRSLTKFRKEATELATLDEETARSCIYALSRKEKGGGRKVIEGPSARFAEIMAYSWGNARVGARSLGDDGQFTKSQGMFFDLQQNVAISYEVSRRITDSNGKTYGADMIGVTSNAASSIALRNAVLKGIPKAIWSPIYEAARRVVAGDMKTLATRRENALSHFAIFGVTPEQIYNTLGVRGKEDITLDHMVTLAGYLTSIKEGDAQPEEIFKDRATETAETQQAAATRKAQDIIAKHKEKAAAATATQAAPELPAKDDSNGDPGPQELPPTAETLFDTTTAAGAAAQPRKARGGTPISEPQRKRFYVIAKKSNATDDNIRAVLKHHGYEHSADIATADYEGLCACFESGEWAEYAGTRA